LRPYCIVDFLEWPIAFYYNSHKNYGRDHQYDQDAHIPPLRIGIVFRAATVSGIVYACELERQSAKKYLFYALSSTSLDWF